MPTIVFNKNIYHTVYIEKIITGFISVPLILKKKKTYLNNITRMNGDKVCIHTLVCSLVCIHTTSSKYTYRQPIKD